MKVVELSGGVGGALMARGLAAVLGEDLAVVVNVGDDAGNHGLRVSPDLDTVVYTMAGVEGPEGWGRAGDTFHLNEELALFGVDNSFRLGDRDLALKLFRTNMMGLGAPLSEVTSLVARAFGLSAAVIPVTNDELRTQVRVDDGWIGFQEYFVARAHRDTVSELRFEGSEIAQPAPGVVELIDSADVVVIGPSNPPLSIWPILSLGQVRAAVAGHPKVIAVSPLFAGKAVKGPASEVMASLGLPPGTRGIMAAYHGLLSAVVVDDVDAADARISSDVEIVVTGTRIQDPESSRRLAEYILRL